MIVFCGYANIDLTVGVPALPAPGDRVQATAIRQGHGGMAANASAAAARAGADAWFAGVVGPEPRSTAFLAALAADGVRTDWTARTGTLTTAVVLLTPDGERAVISQDDELDARHIIRTVRAAREAGADWLYLDGYRFPEAAAALAEAAADADADARPVRPDRAWWWTSTAATGRRRCAPRCPRPITPSSAGRWPSRCWAENRPWPKPPPTMTSIWS
ncbi:carbohydrate kinase family protein [Streptomyces rapamycinicus]|uniref:carbohydrate kinase family protein n=1 Tax=Streptomyces rapamycinicus TaxID=1226757 RepID=UPI0032D978F6